MDLVFAHDDLSMEADPTAERDPFASIPTVTAEDSYWFKPTRNLTGITPFVWYVPCGQSAS
jgi:hypothetical protein